VETDDTDTDCDADSERKQKKGECAMSKSLDSTTRLPFKTRPLEVLGRSVEEYIIPEAMRGEVLEELYPFSPVPRLGEMRYDLHEEKLFQVRDFRVVRDMGMNWLVSPYYPSSGGTVIDWAQSDWADGGGSFQIEQLGSGSESGGGMHLITGPLGPMD
jgi:hypothetical protein